MAPESTEVVPGSRAVVGAPSARAATSLAANFRLTIAGLDCTRVSRIAPLIVRQPVDQASGRMPRSAPARPAALEVGDLVVTLAESHAQTWSSWYQTFVLNGNSDAAHEKSGRLELLAPNQRDVLLTLEMSALGVHSLVADAQPPGGEAIRRVRASVYCEQVAIKTPA